MDCATCEAMVEAYLDGELTAAESVQLEAALEACPGCREKLAQVQMLRGLIRDLPAERAPDTLRARLERELAVTPEPRALRGDWRALAAAAVLVALGLGWLGGSHFGAGRGGDDIVAGYLRVTAAERPVEVASSDSHTVKPWFAGRIDYAPPVHDLTAAGFPLLGGRVDVLDGRKTAVLVYRRNQHLIALSLWPASSSGDSAPEVGERRGFAVARWRHAGFEMRAIADIAPREMGAFAASVDRAIDAAR